MKDKQSEYRKPLHSNVHLFPGWEHTTILLHYSSMDASVTLPHTSPMVGLGRNHPPYVNQHGTTGKHECFRTRDEA